MSFMKRFEDLRSIVLGLRSKINRTDIVNETSGYISDTEILVRNDIYENNVVDGLRDGTTIKFAENKNTNLYIYNANCSSVIIENESIPLSKNKINALEYRYVKGQWIIDIKSYPNSILEGLLASYTANMVIKDPILGNIIRHIPDLSGNGYNINGVAALAGRSGIAGYLGYKKTSSDPTAGLPGINFDVKSTEINDAKISLNSLDYAKGLTIYLGGYCTPLSGASREFFQLGDSSNPSLTNGVVGIVETDTKLTIKVYDNSGVVAAEATVDRGTTGLGGNFIITYNPTEGKVIIYNNFIQVAEGTLTDWNPGKDLLIGNSFVPTSDSYFRTRGVKIWNKILDQNELDYIKNVDLRNRL